MSQFNLFATIPSNLGPRPISKAYMSSLSSRIALLEGMLQERGVAPPPAVHPPKTRHEAALQGKLDGDRHRRTATDDQTIPNALSMPVSQPPTPPASVDEDVDMRELKRERDEVDNVPSYSSRICLIEPSLLQDFEPKRDVNVRHLLHPSGRVSFDQSAGRIRYFGNTSNIHVYAESSCPAGFREQPAQVRRSERVIRALGSSTHDYLMSSFWDHYNSGHQIVDQATFEADRVSQDPKFYSLFLHMAVLAAGYRFADRTRGDVKKLGLGTWESTLHREAKSMLETELERPGEIPSVQALLILADLECGVGRDTQGWLYSGKRPTPLPLIHWLTRISLQVSPTASHSTLGYTSPAATTCRIPRGGYVARSCLAASCSTASFPCFSVALRA